jgi:hypothetical protein
LTSLDSFLAPCPPEIINRGVTFLLLRTNWI